MQIQIALKNSSKNREAWRVNGILKKEHIRCGKSNCKCTKGGKHGPYWHLVWRDGEKSCRRYIKRKNLDIVRAAIKRGHKWHDTLVNQRQRLRADISLSKLLIKKSLRGYEISKDLVDMGLENIDRGLKSVSLHNRNGWYFLDRDEYTQLHTARFIIDCFVPDAK